MSEQANHSSAEGSEIGSKSRASSSTSADNESILVRLKIFLWLQHQPAIAALLLACVVGMSAYFAHRSHVHNGLIEIDRSGSLEANFQVDINAAQFGEIVTLPGVGEKLAQTIVEYRQQTGPFDSVESLTQVPGIGEKKLEAMLPYLVPIGSN